MTVKTYWEGVSCVSAAWGIFRHFNMFSATLYLYRSKKEMKKINGGVCFHKEFLKILIFHKDHSKLQIKIVLLFK